MSHTDKTKVSSFLQEDIHPRYAYALLFACCLTSGLVDSSIYNAYNTFVSMQTGNTIFVGLGASNQSPCPYGWARSLTSIGCFVLGSFVFSRLSSTLGPRRRGTLILSFLLQVAMLIVTASLVDAEIIAGATAKTLNRNRIDWTQEAAIVLLSFQSAGQIVTSRALGFNEIPTVVITSLLCDLVSDTQLFALRNGKRNRRVVSFCLTLLGAIAGGWITRATGGIVVVLWVAVGIKAVVMGFWVIWTAESNEMV